MTTFSDIKTLLLTLALLMAAPFVAYGGARPDVAAAESPAAPVDVAAAVDSIIAGYDSKWQALSMQGKLSFDGLPLRPTVKIYMKRGESIIMSARAPIMGEVARIEISPDSITGINKFSRTYCSYPLSALATGTIADLQDILLGQVAFPGNGRITREKGEASEWIPVPERGVMLYPGPGLQRQGIEYAFIMEPEHWQLLSFAIMLTKTKIKTLLETDYLYGENGWTLGIALTIGDKEPQKGELELSYPDYAPLPLTFTDAGAKYRKTDIRGFLKF